MDPREALRLAAQSLRANKMRSVLTLLGVIIGIASVISIMSLGKAMQQQVLADFEQFGLNDVNVQVQGRQPVDGTETLYAFDDVPDSALITPDMADELEAYLGGKVQGIAFEGGSATARITRGLNEGRATVSFVNDDYVAVQRLPMTAGRLLNDDDITGDRSVAVISPEVVERYFNGDPESAIGATLDVDVEGRFASLQVVGAYGRAEATSVLATTWEEAMLYVPYTAKPKLSAEPLQGFRTLQIRAASKDLTDQVAADAATWAERAYAEDPDYTAKVLDTKRELDQVNQTMATMSLVVSAIGAISLLVGGIGVMNIMLVSVTERTREIGVRIALGATRRAVRMQFVAEAMMICLLGGVLGILLGTAIGMAGTSALGTMVLPPLGAVVISLAFSLAIGLFFGIYPANRAARMNPIEALRHE